MSLASLAKLEKELYPPVTETLESLGLRVWEEATIRAGEAGTRTADHVAWRWVGDEIEACAVEVKPGALSVGLAQAVAYAVGFDRVFVAAEEPLADAGYMGKVLERLGLGYIRVDRSRSIAMLEREAEPSAFVRGEVRAENDARVRVKHLWNEGVVGEPTRFGRDRRGPIWGVTGTTKDWQICVLLYPESTHTYLSLVAESTGLGRRVADRLGPSEFVAATEMFADENVEVHLKRREHKFQPRYSEPPKIWYRGGDVTRLSDLLSTARTFTGHNVGPWFEIRTKLWAHSARLTEVQAAKELRAAVDRMRPVRDGLNKLVGR